MRKATLLLLACLAGTMLAATMDGFDPDTDLGAIQCAWQVGGANATPANLVLAERAEWGSPIPAQGPELRLLVLLNPEATGQVVYKARSLKYLDEEDGAIYDWHFKFLVTDQYGAATSTTDQSVTVTPLPEYAAGIPSDATMQVLNAAGDAVVATIPAPDASAQVTLAANTEYILRVSTPSSLVAVELELALQPGWNLIGIPLTKVTAADALLNHWVINPVDNTRVTSVAGLESGRAYWVYNGTGASQAVIIAGKADIAEPSHLPELTAKWNFATPIARYVLEGNSYELIGVDGFQWLPAKGCYQPISGAAELGRGYVVPKE